MLKKLLFIIGLIIFMGINLNHLFADEKIIIPLKKPTLSVEETKKIIFINILRPLPKPKKNLKTSETQKLIVKKEKKEIDLVLPKKKPIIASIDSKNKTTPFRT